MNTPPPWSGLNRGGAHGRQRAVDAGRGLPSPCDPTMHCGAAHRCWPRLQGPLRLPYPHLWKRAWPGAWGNRDRWGEVHRCRASSGLILKMAPKQLRSLCRAPGPPRSLCRAAPPSARALPGAASLSLVLLGVLTEDAGRGFANRTGSA